jgi:NADH-quinone oxidoreductase subunit L
MSINQMAVCILALPLIGGIIAGTIGKKIPKNIVGSISTATIFIAFALAISILSSLQGQHIVHLFDMIALDNFKLSAALQIDALSIWMTVIITGVGALIHLFSIGYMHDDIGFAKFFSYLNLFVFSMLILVLSSNYFLLYFGWEGVGICSYLLIGYYYSDEQKGYFNGLAGRKSFIMNRIGDLGLWLGFFMIVQQYGTLEYSQIAQKVLVEGLHPATWTVFGMTLCLFIGATGKSAQIPLFTWLPDAMAGPTPVSALIHAATMVTAGIFLLVRSNFLFDLAPLTQDIVLYVGLITSLVAAFIALRQNDIKKVLAYSTISQLGFMFVALGLGAYTVAMFHVTTHAFFKALLFLGSGSVIHSLHGEQNIRKMGGLRKKMPVTNITFLMATLAITGFPLFSGFYSKDEILAHTFEHGPLVYGILMISTAFTAIYMFRLYFLTFSGKYRGNEETEHHIHESPLNMSLPLVVLAVLSVFGGLLDLPGLFLKNGTHWLSNFLTGNTAGLKATEAHMAFSTTMTLMFVASLLTIVVIIISYMVYVKKASLPLEENEMKGWEKLSAKKLFWDEAYDLLFVQPFALLSKIFHNVVDVLLLNQSIYRLSNFVGNTGDVIRKWQTGLVSSYLLWMVIGMVGLITYFLIKI